MAGTASIDAPALTRLIERLQRARVAMAAPLAAANVEIEAAMRDSLTTLYGERLAAHWQTEGMFDTAGERLASFRVWSDDPRVRGYEFGTRSHEIAAHQPPSALAFQWQGAQAFFVRVNHPGTRPHDFRDSVRMSLQLVARRAWSEAVREAFRSTR